MLIQVYNVEELANILIGPFKDATPWEKAAYRELSKHVLDTFDSTKEIDANTINSCFRFYKSATEAVEDLDLGSCYSDREAQNKLRLRAEILSFDYDDEETPGNLTPRVGCIVRVAVEHEGVMYHNLKLNLADRSSHD